MTLTQKTPIPQEPRPDSNHLGQKDGDAIEADYRNLSPSRKQKSKNPPKKNNGEACKADRRYLPKKINEKKNFQK